MITEDEIRSLGYDLFRMLEDGSFIAVMRMTFGKGRLIHSQDIWGYDEFWCYTHYANAIIAMNEWRDGVEPEGWMRHVPSNRRRPDGDKTKEYIAP